MNFKENMENKVTTVKVTETTILDDGSNNRKMTKSTVASTY